jgi:hypothetical protein
MRAPHERICLHSFVAWIAISIYKKKDGQDEAIESGS